jgi:hypothetical protein
VCIIIFVLFLTFAEERKPDRRFAYANPTLVQRRQADADHYDLLPTLVRRHPADWDRTL